MKYIGAHFSIGDGFSSLVDHAEAYGANAFALFTKPAIQWRGKIITESQSSSFIKKCDGRYAMLAHASYLINMGSPDDKKRENAKKAFIEEAKRCRQLGISLLNFHPGSYLNGNINTAIKLIGECVRETIDAVPGIVPVFETMAGQGTNIGSKLEEIRDLIAATNREEQVGVCIDTCHSFAAGYDIRTQEAYESFMEKFDEIIGVKWLKGMHLNDSKNDFGSKKDRHESLGKGFIGIDAFKFIVQDKRTDDIPLVLETPDISVWKKEIELLKSFAINK